VLVLETGRRDFAGFEFEGFGETLRRLWGSERNLVHLEDGVGVRFFE
jgi:hypothetical protein